MAQRDERRITIHTPGRFPIILTLPTSTLSDTPEPDSQRRRTMTIKEFVAELEANEGKTPLERLAKLEALVDASGLDIDMICRIKKVLHSRNREAQVRCVSDEVSS